MELSNPAKFLAIEFTPGVSVYPHVGGLSKSGRFLVLRGDDHRYSLVKILDIALEDTVTVVPMTKCPSALRLYWQKQLNNQPFFEMSPTVGIAGHRPRVTGTYRQGYSIDGRRAQPPGAGTPRRTGRAVLPAARGR